MLREALELAGVTTESMRAKLEAAARAKAQRLYGSGAGEASPAPAEPERGSAEWLAAQAAWESSVGVRAHGHML